MYKGHRKRATHLAAVLLGFFGLIVLATDGSTAAPQAPAAAWPVVLPGPDSVYVARCAACHGADGTGASAKSILPYVRYHTDKELAQRVVAVHTSGVEMSADEHRRLAAELRNMTGTNPSMATGGYVGARGRSGRGATRTEPQTHAKPVFTPVQARLKLADGRTLTGRLMAQTNTDATLLGSDGRFHLLSRTGSEYREKPIAPKQDWLDNHGDKTGNRYSTLNQINTGNVHRLAKLWEFPIPTSARLQATPIVVDGIMYMVGWNEMYALDATSGEQLWSYSEPRHEGILGEAGDGANKGAAVSSDRVFMVTDHAHVVALDRRTGSKLWDAEMGDYTEGYSSSVAPLVVGNLVITGVSCGEEGCRGLLDAYEASTGRRVWRFYTIPARGEPGSETWIGQALEHGCGTTWNTGSYDATLDLVYWGTGNPCPDLFGDERQGDNLYTSSVVALEVKTGKLKWHYQFTPHDIYDWDSAQPMVLIDEVLQGTPRKLLMHADKNGVLYVLDRTNGKLLRGSPFASVVNWQSGFDANGRPVLAQPDIRCPNEAVNWMDVAFSPITKLFYGNVTDACSLGGPPRAGIDPLMQNNRWFGTTDRMVASPETSQRLEQMRAQYPRGPFMRAIDLATGAKAWDYNMGPGRSTGVLATAGNVVFIGGKGGIVALDAKTGQELSYVDAAQTKCDGLCHSAAAMTYMVGGKQYIAMPGSGVLIVYALADAAVPLASR